MGAKGIPHGCDMLVGKKVDMARNLQAHAFLEQGWTHLFFVDDDQAWSADLILRLLLLNVDIVGVPIRKRMEKEVYNLNHGTTANRLPGRDDVLEVNFIGTGIMMIRRNVLEILKDKVKQCEQIAGTLTVPMFFETKIVEKPNETGVFQDQGEDVSFCKLAQEHGFKIYAYLDEEVAHLGDKAYVGNYAQCVGKDSEGKTFISGELKEPLRILKHG